MTAGIRSPRARRGLLAAGLTVLVAACAGTFLSRGQSDRIHFSHQRHAKAKVECIACHETIYDSTELATANARPRESKCMECHQKQKDQGNCGMCHTDPAHPAPYVLEDTHLRLNHAAHIERTKEDCTVCHKALPEPGAEHVVPAMDTCKGCHEHQVAFDEARCNTCHIDLARYPLEPVSSFSHQGNFVKQHPRAARSAGSACSQCHDQTFCSTCHAQTVAVPVEVRFPEKVSDDFLIHRGDWLSRHSTEAAADPALCKRCHGVTFCTTCHAAQNLTPNASNPRNPHPPGWAFPGPNSHAAPARRDIASCQACHDQGPASICVNCHKVGGIGGNPHPPGWLASHNSAQIQRNSMCLYCHQ